MCIRYSAVIASLLISVCLGANEAVVEAAASTPRSSSPTPGVHSAARRRLSSQPPLTPVRLRVLTPAGLRRAHHDRLDDVGQTATTQRPDQRPAAALHEAPGVHRLRRGRRSATSASAPTTSPGSHGTWRPALYRRRLCYDFSSFIIRVLTLRCPMVFLCNERGTGHYQFYI